MQVSWVTLDDDTADQDVKPSDDEIKVIGNLRLSYSHRRSTLADFNDETASDLRLAHPLSGKQQIAKECDTATVPLAAKVVGLDTAEISRSLGGFHRVSSMLAAPLSCPATGARQLVASIRRVRP